MYLINELLIFSYTSAIVEYASEWDIQKPTLYLDKGKYMHETLEESYI